MPKDAMGHQQHRAKGEYKHMTQGSVKLAAADRKVSC